MKKIFKINTSEYQKHFDRPLITTDYRGYVIEFNTGINAAKAELKVTALRADEAVVSGIGTVSDEGIASYTLEQSMFSVPGKLRVRLQVVKDGAAVTEKTLYFNVEDGDIPTETGTTSPSVIDLILNRLAGINTKLDNYSGNAPYIGENDNWYQWDVETEAYIDTGVAASNVDTITNALLPMFPNNLVISASKTVTVYDAKSGVNLIDYSITGTEEGVGNLNEETGKYEIPVLVSTPNLVEWDNTSKWGIVRLQDLGYGYGNAQKYASYDLLQAADAGDTITVYYKCKDGATPALRLYTNDTDLEETGGTATVKLINAGSLEYEYLTINIKNDCVYYLIYPTNANSSEYDLEAWLTYFEYIRVCKETGDTVTFELDAPLAEGEELNLTNTQKQIPVPFSGECEFYVDTVVAPSEFSIKYYRDINKMIEMLDKKIAEVQALVLE